MTFDHAQGAISTLAPQGGEQRDLAMRQRFNSTRRLRVLRISHSANMSAYRERDRALARLSDLDIALICPKRWSHLGGVQEEVSESFLTKCVNTIGTGSVPLFAFDPDPIAATLKQFRPDVVDIHEEPYSVSCFEIMALVKMFAPQATVVFYSAQNIKKRYPLPFSWSERFVYQHSQGAYPCSEGVRNVLQAKGFAGRCPIIPLGIDPAEFSPSAEPFRLPAVKDSSYVIGYAGRLEACKGVECLLRALRVVKERLAGDAGDVRLAVVGRGAEEQSLKSLAQKLGIAPLIVWLGELSLSQMPAFYRACDVVVVPSLTTPTWKEQFGRVPVEAMSSGTPVIVSDSGSLPEVVRGGAGIVVPERDHLSLANALERLCKSPSEAEELINNGYKLVAQQYTWTQIAQAMRSLYFQAHED